MHNINLDKIFKDKELQYQITHKQMERCEAFKNAIYNRPYHNQQAEDRHTTPEQLAQDFKIGVMLEGATRTYLKSVGVQGLSQVDFSIRPYNARGGHNADLTNGELDFNCKAFNYDRWNGKIEESYLFQKSALKHEYPDTEYFCCGSVSGNLISIRAVVRMSVVRGLLLAPKSEKHKADKKALYAWRLLDPELGLTEAA